MAIVNKRDIGLVLTEDGYQIRIGEELSDEMGIGEGPLIFDCNGKTYGAYIDTPEGGESEDVVSLLGEGFVFELVDTMAEVEEEDGDDGGDDDGGEEADVEVSVDEEQAA